MNLNKHSNLIGQHAFLSPSKSSWLRYSDEDLLERKASLDAKILGTELHELAAMLIEKRKRLEHSEETLNLYVNDAIEYGMVPEQPLVYSHWCHGTADTILFDENSRVLRIHDYKSGSTKVSMDQLLVYAALFFLEYSEQLYLDYGLVLSDITIILRIYQNNAIEEYKPTTEEIASIMDNIIHKSRILDNISK